MTACYRERARCRTVGCRHAAVVLCRYPVERRGRAGKCSRFVCARCASADRFCPPHARAGRASLVTICAACLTSSCVAGDAPCERRDAGTRTITITAWKKLLSFGAL